jgi:hypothetical protein
MAGDPALLRVPTRFQSVAEVLATAAQMDLPNILILSEKEDGTLVFLEAPELDIAHCNWLLDRMKTLLLMPTGFDRKDP